ncbi:MAG: hypothetical protein H5U03_05790, partial [Clostridia bacterium]|nr:hypothetical protein [Clostridia bacterium]
ANLDKLHLVAQALIERETLEASEFVALLERGEAELQGEIPEGSKLEPEPDSPEKAARPNREIKQVRKEPNLAYYLPALYLLF